MAKTVKKEKAPEHIKVTVTELLNLQNTDRSRADVRKWWIALQRAEQIANPNRTTLYDLYERIILDGHLTGIIGKRLAALQNKTLHYEINGQRVEELDTLIQSAKFREMIQLIFEKKTHGLTGIEFKVGEEFDFVPMKRKHIKPEIGIYAEEQNAFTGYAYKDIWNMWVLEDIDRFGFLLKCCPYVIWKTGSIADLAQYIEIFGQPMRIAKYDGDDLETKAELRKALEESGGSIVLMLPNGAEVEIKSDHISNGTGEVHSTMFSTCNNELSVIVLGNTETTSNDNGGSNAKSKEHGKQQLEITKSDLIDMENALSCKEFKAILKSYGYPVSPDDKGKFVYEKEIDLDELKKDKEIDAWLGGVVPLDDDYYYQKYGRPKPDNYNELKKKMDEERQAKLQSEMQPPSKPKPKPKPLTQDDDDFPFDLDPDEDDEEIVGKVKIAASKFLSSVKSFFARARQK